MSETPIKPFRLLDLPKEIRLIIYEHLTPTWKQYWLRLGANNEICLVVPSVPIRILQTSHQINQEATPILRRTLTPIMRKPPTIYINASSFQYLIYQTTQTRHAIFDKIIHAAANKRAITAIHRFRNREISMIALRKALKLHYEFTHQHIYPDETICGIASFILQANLFAKIQVPVRLVVSIDAWSLPQLSPRRLSIRELLLCRILRRAPLPRFRFGMAPEQLGWFFAYYTTMARLGGDTVGTSVYLWFREGAELCDEKVVLMESFGEMVRLGMDVFKHHGLGETVTFGGEMVASRDM